MPASERPSLANVYAVVVIGCVFAALYSMAAKDPPPIVGAFILFAPVVAVVTWFRRYLRSATRALPFDAGLILWIGWPVLIPLYAYRLRGVRGFRLAAGLFGLIVAPLFAGAVAVLFGSAR